MGNYVEYETEKGQPHPYHLVRPSVWPLLSSFAGGLLAVGLVLFMHDAEIAGMKVGLKGVYAGTIAVLLCMFFWWKDIIFEATTEKAHSDIAKIGMRYGMMLFIASEVMFFVAFFWAFFAAAFYPVGGVWPPEGIHVMPVFELPLLMTLVLLLSGCTVTWAHHAFLENKINDAVKALTLTVLLAVFFLGIQAYEYMHAPFGFGENVYTSAFYMATGFHGFHVLVGTIFLFVCLVRTKKGHFDAKNHFGFEAAAWYWHFVDVVWLFLFIAVYWWGAGDAPVAAH
jgi:cytochrome c oxidase subunit 3